MLSSLSLSPTTPALSAMPAVSPAISPALSTTIPISSTIPATMTTTSQITDLRHFFSSILRTAIGIAIGPFYYQGAQ
jgi:hypothetical protein